MGLRGREPVQRASSVLVALGIAWLFVLLAVAPAGAAPQAYDNRADAIAFGTPLTIGEEAGVAGATLTTEGLPLEEDGSSGCDTATGTLLAGGGVFMGFTGWWKVVAPPGGGPLTVSARSSNVDTVLGVYDSNTGTLVSTSAPYVGLRGCDDDIFFGSSGPPPRAAINTSELQFPSTAGRTYWIQIGCYSGKCNGLLTPINLYVNVLAAPPNDDRSNAITIAEGQTVAPVNFTGATVQQTEDTVCDRAIDKFDLIRTVWYRWVAPARGAVVLRGITTDDVADNVIQVFRAGTKLGCDDLAANNTGESRVALEASKGDVLEIQLGAYRLSHDSPLDSRTGLARPAVDFTPSLDQDRDNSNRPADCNDEDPAVHPGAPEVPNNDVDENCDGVKTFDRDNDKFLAPPTGSDCNDNDAAVHPGAPEVPNNDVDENCDGTKTFDRDGDKHLAPPAGDDCDDNDANRHPGLAEIPGDGVDQDCSNGLAVRNLSKPRAAFFQGGVISVNGRAIKFAATALVLSDLTPGARVTVRVCRHGCKMKRFTAKSSRKRVYFSSRRRQVVLTGATIDIKVYMPAKADVAGAYLRLRTTLRGAKQCSGSLRTGGTTVSGKICRPR